MVRKTKNNKLKLCVIGAGSIFQNFHYQAIEETGMFKFVGAVDTNKSNAKKVSEQLKIPVYDSVNNIPDADVCFVATPPHIRSQIIIPALEKGMHVVCEKPFAYTSQEGKKMVEVADKNNRSIYVTQTRRYFSNILMLRNLIEGNLLNDIINITIVEGGLYGWSSVGNERAKAIANDSGVLHDTGSHLVDMLLFILDSYDLDINDIKVKKSLMDFQLASNNFKCELELKFKNQRVVPVKIILSRDQNLQNCVRISSTNSYVRSRSLFENNIKIYTKDKFPIKAESDIFPNNMNDVFSYLWKHIGTEIKFPQKKMQFSFNAKTVLLTLELIDKLIENKKVIEFNDYYYGEWN